VPQPPHIGLRANTNETSGIKGFAGLFRIGYTEFAPHSAGASFQKMTKRTLNSTTPSRPTPESRRQTVLATIIQEHLLSGEPVGSHTVADQFAYATGWSSATIRNVMAELDDFGLLEQPHTSAGRIPTDRGYR